MDTQDLTLRSPTVSDGAAIWQLVAEAGTLERNTSYAYLLLASHFSGTSVVAEKGGRLLGFVAAYRPPSRPEAIFVWQVGVHPDARGLGLAGRMLDWLFESPGAHGARWLEATVTPDNQPSNRLFQSFARRHEVAYERINWFESKHFPGGEHAPELLYRIGPVRTDAPR